MKKVAILVVLIMLCSAKVFALTDEGYKRLHAFTEILHQVEMNYVDVVDERRLVGGAIRGMLQTLDPHTVYLPPDVYRDIKIESAGRFGGIGIEVALQGGWLTVVAPIEGSPAAKAGVKAGDRVVKIDGVSTKGVDLGEAVQMMRGGVGGRVSLTLTRKNVKKPIDVSMVRKVINVPSITMEDLGDGYYYARISTFQEKTAQELTRKLKDAEGRGEVKGLLIDLRNDPGGLLGQAIEVADLFLESGVIVSTRSKNKEIARYDATPQEKPAKYPIVVLVNGGSASASEILAGALKDYNRALLVGTQTFGKGSVQSIIELGDGSALKITVAKYYTPSGVSIQGFGITPEVVVEESEEEGKDPQKDEAISYLKDPLKYQKALKGTRKHHQ